ncbi:MAG: hypothetical protein ABSE84_04440 [Isosphaeraceae bacterium]
MKPDLQLGFGLGVRPGLTPSSSLLLVYKHHGNPRTTAALKDVLKYCVTDGQKDCVALGYIPLPEKVRQAELQAVDAIAP